MKWRHCEMRKSSTRITSASKEEGISCNEKYLHTESNESLKDLNMTNKGRNQKDSHVIDSNVPSHILDKLEDSYISTTYVDFDAKSCIRRFEERSLELNVYQ